MASIVLCVLLYENKFINLYHVNILADDTELWAWMPKNFYMETGRDIRPQQFIALIIRLYIPLVAI